MMPAKFADHLQARILTKRADFLRAKAQGLKVPTQGFALQIVPEPTEAGLGLGVTCAKRSFGSAIAMNRARRRLKEAWRLVLQQNPKLLPKSCKIVLVGRVAVLEMDFAHIVKDMEGALAKVPVLLTEVPKTGTNAAVKE